MTTIAYKEGVMVGDKQMGYHSSNVTKVFKLDNGPLKGSLLGVSGDSLGSLMLFKDWLEEKRSDAFLPTLEQQGTFTAMLVEPDRSITLYFSSYSPVVVEETFMAVGSGSDYAMGAMWAGADAWMAVDCAATYDASTSQRHDTVKLDPIVLKDENGDEVVPF